jgi:DNA polymerase-3 subunit alpha
VARSFAHLHQHTEFSMLDGAARVADVVAAAAADGQPALGITDHGNMYGVLDFYAECRKQGINPVLGTEAYMAHDHRSERPPRRGRIDDSGGDVDGGKKLYYHLCLYAENDLGYRNLIKLSSEAYLSGFHYKPRCLVPGQEIVTATGTTAIEDISVGDLVLTHTGRLRPVLQVMERQFTGTLYGVRLNNRYGRVTWMTAEHPVLVRHRDGSRSWVEVQDIVAGRHGSADGIGTWESFACLPKLRPDQPLDLVATADYVDDGWVDEGERFVKESMRRVRGATRHRSTLASELVLDYDLGFFLGLYAAEGHIARGEVRISLHEAETDLADHCVRLMKMLTGREASVRGRLDRPGYRGIEVRLASAPLARLLRSLCGTGAAQKHLPDFSFDANDDFRAGLLDGVLAGDGSVRADGTIFTQTSPDLAWQVRQLATNERESFACVAPQHDGHERHATQYRMNIATGDGRTGRHVLADDEYVYRPIAEILTREFEGTVYNIEVADDHSYVSDFAIHNCDWELLEQYGKGLIATTGCLGGHVLQALLRGDEQGAIEKASRLQDIFGRDNLFVELQDHGIPDQKRTNPLLLEIARKIQAPLLATNDSHYVHQHDSVAHDALLCVQTGCTIDDPNRFKFSSDQHYLKSALEMRSLFDEVPEACDNTLWVAERCNVEIEFGKPKLPSFPLPEGFASDAEYLKHLTYEGARERWGRTLPNAVEERLAYELNVIDGMGFSSYFLIVWDLIAHARRNNIRVGPGRGSAAGCAVAYTLRITDLDPIKYDLLFERFLNPSRISMPDIDMDFDDRYRDEMIRYAAEKYGRDHVAQIVTFSTIKARAAVRDAARVLGYPYAVGDRVAKAMPPLVMGKDTPLYACLEEHPKYEDGFKAAAELRDMYAVDPDVQKVVDVARGLEGLRRGDGIHAAAVVITNEPLTEYLPIQRKPEAGKAIEDAPIVTQYEMHGVEELGLLKMDFLGLRNLSTIENALDLIERTTGDRPDIDGVALDDEPTFELLRRGDSIGVFQLEGGPMRALMRSLAPTSFDDVAALVALYRPGPMAANMHNDYADRKNGRKPLEFLHEDATEMLGDTQGLMIYQESLMRVAQKFAGYSLADADNLRRACGKKKREVMAAERAKFVDAVEATGYTRDLGTKWFDIIEPFADYAFPKAHAYGYGLVAYQTAWLKANHPVEYLAALLTSVKDNQDKSAVYLNECRSKGITVTVPNVNRSLSDFAVDDRVILFGLSAVRNVGEGLVGLIIEEREKSGPFADFHDFCDRVDFNVLNKRTIESLIKAGGFDSLGHPRRGLLEVHELIIDRTVARRRKEAEGQFDLFGSMDATAGAGAIDPPLPIPDREFEKMQRLQYEKEMLGLYVSDHPLMGIEHQLRRKADCTIAELRDIPTGGDPGVRTVGGVITGLQRKYTKKGELMAVFVLEDLEAAIEVMVFPKTMIEIGPKLADDRVVCIRGRLDTRDDQPKIVAMDVLLVEVSHETPPLKLSFPAHLFDEAKATTLKRLLTAHPGESPVLITLGTQTLRLPDEFRVDESRGLRGELLTEFGPEALRV